MPKTSIVNPEITFDEEFWLISVLNTNGMSAILGGGHSMIVVEGLKKNSSHFPKAFIGQYDIWGLEWDPEDKSVMNRKGKIKEVRVFEEEDGKPV